MSTAQSALIDVFPNGSDGVAATDHRVELAELQSRQEVLKCTLVAQEKIETIRGDYALLRRLVHRIRELKADEMPSQSQKNFVDDLFRQEESLDSLATSLVCFLE
jgi:hypothetical protein